MKWPFQVLGFYVMLDENLKPYLLEVNSSPSLAIDSVEAFKSHKTFTTAAGAEGSNDRRTDVLERCASLDAPYARCLCANHKGEHAHGAFYLTLVPIRPRRRGERRSLRTLPGVSLRPPLAFNPRLRRLSTPPRHSLVWNDPKACPAVALCVAGHDHPGGYGRTLVINPKDGLHTFGRVHHVTLEAMLEAKRGSTSYATLEVYDHDVAVVGVGAATSRRLQARSISHWFPYDRVGVVNADP